MFPLAMHKGAREQCVAVVCDKKSFEELENGYTSDNQCAAGAKLVDDTVALLSGKGITGTPTYLFGDGRFQSGVLEADAVRQRLGLPAAAKPPAPAPTPPAPPAKK
jgi:thiol:disulfide interchange protein DsbC